MPKAWRSFFYLVTTHFEKDRAVPKQLAKDLPFVRVTEVTPGGSNEGHAHFHIYLFSPYIHHQLVRHYWGLSLKKLGYEVPTRPLQQVFNEVSDPKRRSQLESYLVTRRGIYGRPLIDIFWPVIHIQKCRGDVSNELAKYLVKDIERTDDGQLRLVDSSFYAKAYEGMEGKRMIATSRGFWPESTNDSPDKCEKCGSFNIERRFKTIESEQEETRRVAP